MGEVVKPETQDCNSGIFVPTNDISYILFEISVKMKILSILLLTAMVAIEKEQCSAKYLLVEIDDAEGRGMLASRQEGEPCGQSGIENCGECDNGFICSTETSPMIPDQCGICKPERRRSDAVDLTLVKKEPKTLAAKGFCRTSFDCSSSEMCCYRSCVPAGTPCVPTNELTKNVAGMDVGLI